MVESVKFAGVGRAAKVGVGLVASPEPVLATLVSLGYRMFVYSRPSCDAFCKFTWNIKLVGVIP